MTEEIKKLYYTISEVTEMTELKQYVLRYWETEFDVLKPLKNRSGNRIYTKEDIDNIRTIKKLLYEEKYTVEGAKRRFNESYSAPPADDNQKKALVAEIRSELKDALNLLTK